MHTVAEMSGLALLGATAIWFSLCAAQGLRSGKVRPACKKQPYARTKHPWAFWFVLAIWLAFGGCAYAVVARLLEWFV